MEKIIIVTVDMGHFKAYRVTHSPHASAKTDLIESYDTIGGHDRLSDKVSDSAGRFQAGDGTSQVRKGYGEPHNIMLEEQKKISKLIAKNINTLIGKEKCNEWYLAAAEKINGQIVKNLEPAVKAKLTKNIAADFTKIHRSELLSRFE